MTDPSRAREQAVASNRVNSQGFERESLDCHEFEKDSLNS
jgi:hypothetical protein